MADFGERQIEEWIEEMYYAGFGLCADYDRFLSGVNRVRAFL
jgi:hypothetical protein